MCFLCISGSLRRVWVSSGEEDTVYTWDPTTGQSFANGVETKTSGNNQVYMSIWDGGGNDTYDLSKYTSGVVIDLTPGAGSTFSKEQLAALADGSTAANNVVNQVNYLFETRTSIIENAIGGSGNDSLTGNDFDNRLVGNDGRDSLLGAAGGDTLEGGRGRDLISGGDGADVLFGGFGNDILRGEAGDDVLHADRGRDRLSGGVGDDLFVIGRGAKRVVITDFAAGAGGVDEIQISKDLFKSFAALKAAASQSGRDVVISKGDLTLVLSNVKLASLAASDFYFV